MNNLFSINTITVLLVYLSLNACIAPRKNFESYTPPIAPDYSNPNNWAALPSKKDNADLVPKNSSCTNNQDKATVDVFFIHPTSYLKKKSWNAAVENKKVNKRTDKGSIKNQASTFNGSCKIYAPRYRQATLYSFLDKKDNGKKALELAYQDVKTAFEFYLKNFNEGRPIIIASHSQGSRHGFRLMKEYFDQNSLLTQKLVAAYLIGLSDSILFNSLPPCDSASQTGCLISWRTARWGTLPDDKFFTPTSICVNPLSWRRNEEISLKLNHKGATPFYLKRIDYQFTDTKINQNILWVRKPTKTGYLKIVKNYHLIDYNLFYMNIRENVETRIKNYWQLK